MRWIVGAVALTLTSPAAAQDVVHFVAFAWARGDGADACPTQPAMMAAVRERLGRDPFAANALVSAEASVERVGARWRARLTFRGDGHTELLRRELDDASPDCATIAQAVVLSLSMGLTPPPPEDAAPARDGEQPPPVLLATPQPPPRPPPRAPREAWLSAGVDALWGPLPAAPSWGLCLQGTWALHRLFDLSLATVWTPEVSLDDTRAYTFGMTRFVLGAHVFVRPVSWLRLFGGVAGHAGSVHVVTFGPSPLEPGDRFWWALAAEGGVDVHVARFVATARGSVGINPAYLQFTAVQPMGERTVFLQPLVFGAASLLVGVEL